MSGEAWQEATYAGHARAQRRRALLLTPVERLAVLERLVRDAARTGVVAQARARKQRDVMAAWEG